jgi:two-component system LytT family response regulator
VIQERGRIRLVKKEDIYRVESEGNYSTIYIKNGEKIVLTKNMKKMEEEFFSEKPFSRVHQSHLVNLNFVEMIVPGDGFIVLENKEEIPLSRSRKETFLDALMGN